MSIVIDNDYLIRIAEMAAARERKQLAIKELLFAGIQVAGGAALAFYTYRNSSSRIAPAMSSAIALGGTYNVFRSIRKIFWRSACNEKDGNYSLRNVATGTIIYFGSLYAFSEAWRSNHKLWMPFLGSSALGFYHTVSSTYSNGFDTIKPLLKTLQLAFEPALVVGGAIYLKCFRSHEEDWVYWFPLVAIDLIGYRFAANVLFEPMYYDYPDIMLLQVIESLMGGCLLTLSSITLAIYVSVKEVNPSLISYALAMGSFGAYVTIGGITCMQWLAGVDEKVAVYVGYMLTAPVTIFVAFLFVQWTEHKRMAYVMFPFLAGGSYYFLLSSVFQLYVRLPWPVFVRYCQRAWGPMLVVSGSAASAYIAYRFGLRSSLSMTPVVSTGIYVTYKGFS